MAVHKEVRTGRGQLVPGHCLIKRVLSGDKLSPPLSWIRLRTRQNRRGCLPVCRRVGNDDGVALRRAEARFQANLPASVFHPFGARLQIGFALRLRRYAWETHILAKLLDEARFILFEIINDSLHDGLLLWFLEEIEQAIHRRLVGRRWICAGTRGGGLSRAAGQDTVETLHHTTRSASQRD